MSLSLEKFCLIVIVSFVTSGNGGCRFPSDWFGSWHHLGYDDPLNITLSGIDMKGTCYEQLDLQKDVNKTGFGQFILQKEKYVFASE